MYVPRHNRLHDREEIYRFMFRNSFAPLVTVVDGTPFATHLPFLIDRAGDDFVLRGHLARANPQWKSFDSGDAMVIFSGPHSYISASWYETADVPTWNYTAVHATGRPRILEARDRTLEIVRRSSDLHEDRLPRQNRARWEIERLDPDDLEIMLQAIVSFEIPVSKIEGKYKLSQNRSETDRRTVVAMLEGFDDPAAREVAALMKAALKGV